MGAQMQRGAYSRVCGASTAKCPAALSYAGAGPALLSFRIRPLDQLQVLHDPSQLVEVLLRHRAEGQPQLCRGLAHQRDGMLDRDRIRFQEQGLEDLAAQTSLSVYSDGRVVVRRTLPQALDRGRNALTLKLDGLEPGTLFSPDTGVTLVSAVQRPATERGAALESAVGQTLSFVRAKGDTVRATVVRVAP